MNRVELIRRAAAYARSSGARKPISIPKQVFHISDDEGNTRDFVINKREKTVLYTEKDVEIILDACLNVIKDAIRSGEKVSIYGFCSITLKYVKQHLAWDFEKKKQTIAEGHYLPKFYIGKELRHCANLYEQSLSDKESVSPPIVDYEEDGD